MRLYFGRYRGGKKVKNEQKLKSRGGPLIN